MIPVKSVKDNYAPCYVPNAVIKRDLQVLSIRLEVRNCSVTNRQRLEDHPNSLAQYLEEQITVIGLSGIIPQI